ncbi:PD-(D/E)XK nuclease family protein [Pedobacter mucosus]|uniref:PD-(D/E)XK nuclease family protein n=1 Tax=Pedobacter mucosus TaxID=2895286 RepID=UPI001EE4E92F|nr:PD-(D/E)XK nuclease family protein [Pedobacter mucosus]UKT65824.1 PD-(D/E)XK nuclease family protein [Pedobacter mucosus]
MKELEIEYKEILNKEISKQEKREKNFLDIAGMPHYENVNSNLLQFFFDYTEDHGFKDLFLTSLLELISHKKDLSFVDWTIAREVRTINDKRIDLAILSTDEDKVIIIENKIYHLLNNDLNDYWNHYPLILEENKVGIVLSLYSLTVKDARYINITHQQLCKRVLKNLGDYILNANHKYVVYLKDFIENINTFYMSDTQKNKLKFYFEHIDKINELSKIKEDATNHILRQVTIVGETLGLPIHAKRSMDRRYFTFPELKGGILYYAIFVEDIFTSEASFRIILEGHDIEDEIQQFVIDRISDKYQNLEHIDTPHNYIHFLRQDYDFKPEDTANFSKAVLDIIERDFAEARKEVTQLLKEKGL